MSFVLNGTTKCLNSQSFTLKEKALLLLLTEIGQPEDDCILVKNLTQQEIGDRLGMTGRTVQRHFASLRKKDDLFTVRPGQENRANEIRINIVSLVNEYLADGFSYNRETQRVEKKRKLNKL